MIFIMYNHLHIDYFSVMLLLLTKRNLLLQVSYAPPVIRVAPVVQPGTEERLAAVFAKNEELLASVFLSIAEPDNLCAQLVQYFQHRGWHVEQLELDQAT